MIREDEMLLHGKGNETDGGLHDRISFFHYPNGEIKTASSLELIFCKKINKMGAWLRVTI